MDLPPPGSPVEDDLKPDLPYVVGARLKIQQCQPHRPFGISFQDQTSRTYHWNPMLKWETASEFCVQNPPLEGQPIANPEKRTIVIDSKLACGDGRGSQLVKCRDEDGGASFVAKIYDPLYHLWPSNLDPTHEADEHFTTEATVYMMLQDMHKANTFGYPRVRDHLKGSTPQYYGSYTWQTQLLDGRRRDVRLILMEYLPFPNMWAIIKKNKVENIPAEIRMQLLKRVLEIDSWLIYYGIDQNDFAARNILVDPDQGRVVFVDFGIAMIRNLYNSEWATPRDKPLPALPISPIERWGCKWGDEMGSWVPKEYRTARARYDWFMKVWGQSKEFRPLGVIWLKHHKPNLQKAIAREEMEE
ncbi:hypothetical protein TGAM01_v205815 [Trichoderma gamsii]|uniref:Protein kinase domain-containing protein n=1 Tax=Trichoderma gamsii TaxID=398673 RepID=A0A0W7W238_9HYPO|nr:hypothetical protein TGAM01_v205815 [Trichoderma gamsii]PNP48475.1 hypothetical protein TGAMA5MH_00513 [Trichoderma gamsii]PON25521.1 hypothetical protein TGAM01_v205815 [Trichoderma gamsii]